MPLNKMVSLRSVFPPILLVMLGFDWLSTFSLTKQFGSVNKVKSFMVGIMLSRLITTLAREFRIADERFLRLFKGCCIS
jgi:hypothetical protein